MSGERGHSCHVLDLSEQAQLSHHKVQCYPFAFNIMKP